MNEPRRRKINEPRVLKASTKPLKIYRRAEPKLLEVCPCCGRHRCLSHTKYVDRCDECGKRYTKYSNYRSLQRSTPTDSRQHKLDEVVFEYKELQRHGYKVPGGI